MARSRIPWRLLLGALILTALAGLSESVRPTQAAGFSVTVSTSAITGQKGKILLFSAEPSGGGSAKVACTPIDAEVFTPSFLPLKEMPQSGNPCEDGSPDAFIVPGMMQITAGIYVGGSQDAEKQVATTVDVQDESSWKLDGVALTADTAGDSGCDHETDAVDALHVLRNVAGIGIPASCLAAGNVKCDDGITAVDSLFILRHVAQLPLNLPQGCPSPFAAPVLVSPGDGEVVHTTVERHVPLDWEPVAGASKYTVQVDCAGCCAGGQFCSDVGRGYRLAAAVAESQYTVSVGGDNLERWRVWVINEDGTPGDFSDWRTFDVDSSGSMR